MQEIKTCPFCDSAASAVRHEHEDGWVDPLTGLKAYFSIECSNDDCPVEFNVWDAGTAEQAIEKWNKRIALNADS
jgi:hypothetical protein